MLAADQTRFPPQTATLRDWRTVTLRFLKTEDTEALVDFYESVELAAYRFYSPAPPTRESAAKKTAAALAPNWVCIVAEAEGSAIVGYNWCKWNPAYDEPSIFGICVRRDYRGNGLGKALMTRLLDVAAEAGPEVMSLTVQMANPRAVALYTSMGFKIVREQTRGRIGQFAPEPEYYMERRVR